MQPVMVWLDLEMTGLDHRRHRIVEIATVVTDDALDVIATGLTEHVPEPRTAPLCGNSIGTDRRFLDQYMPALEEHLHYRVVDVSSIKELAKRWRPTIAAAWADLSRSRAGTTKHRALDDVLESIDELRFYRDQWLQPSATGPAAETDTESNAP